MTDTDRIAALERRLARIYTGPDGLLVEEAYPGDPPPRITLLVRDMLIREGVVDSPAPAPAPEGDAAARWAKSYEDDDEGDSRVLSVLAAFLRERSKGLGLYDAMDIALGLADPPGTRRAEVTDAMVWAALQSYAAHVRPGIVADGDAMRVALEAALAAQEAADA